MMTHHTLVRLLSGVDSHVNEQLVAGIEGLVAANAAGPETGEVLSFALVNVDLLNMPHKLLLLLVRSTAVNPATHLLIDQRSSSDFFPLWGCVRPRRASRVRFESQGRGWCCLLALVVQKTPRTGSNVLVQVVGRRHSGARRVVRLTNVPATTTQVMVMMIVVLKEFVFTRRKIIQGLLFEGSP